jgi:alanyl-tRNA synthetase
MMADKFRDENENAVAIFSTISDEKVVLIATVKESVIKRGIKAGDIVSSASSVVGGKGGGRPTMAQGGGKEIDKIPEALKAAEAYVKGKIN